MQYYAQTDFKIKHANGVDESETFAYHAQDPVYKDSDFRDNLDKVHAENPKLPIFCVTDNLDHLRMVWDHLREIKCAIAFFHSQREFYDAWKEEHKLYSSINVSKSIQRRSI